MVADDPDNDTDPEMPGNLVIDDLIVTIKSGESLATIPAKGINAVMLLTDKRNVTVEDGGYTINSSDSPNAIMQCGAYRPTVLHAIGGRRSLSPLLLDILLMVNSHL